MVQPSGGHSYLFHVSETAINWIQEERKTIGIGSYLTDFVLDSILSDNKGSEEHLIASAVHMLKEVRENIEGCGNDPSIYMFRKDGIYSWIEQEDVKAMGENLTRLKGISQNAFHAVTVGSKTDLGIPLTALRKELALLQKKQEQIVRQIIEKGFRCGQKPADEKTA